MSAIGSFFVNVLPVAAAQIGSVYVRILTNRFDENRESPVTLSHFLPFTRFENGVDQSNGDEYRLCRSSSCSRIRFGPPQ